MEGVGVVEQLGHAVATDWAGTPLSVGDTVYWFPGAGCRRCYNCNVRQDPGACTARLWPHSADVGGPAAYQRGWPVGRSIETGWPRW
ncbi:alcohol dehydrogenase catalytic domain-containing protein [Dactylosporangium salmoneum]|uniref:Alcohol dehydrogenase N-terminal domain-containing protein n=1 Tax=Dactylosporangium salmoneum TaxID=53361 RepID=A0ABP5U7Y8_9ACTN